MTCREFLKILQDNPDCELVFQKIIEPYDYKTHSTTIQKMSDIECRVECNEVVVEFDPFKKYENN